MGAIERPLRVTSAASANSLGTLFTTAHSASDKVVVKVMIAAAVAVVVMVAVVVADEAMVQGNLFKEWTAAARNKETTGHPVKVRQCSRPLSSKIHGLR